MLNSNVHSLVRRLVDGSPADIRLVAQRLQDHAIEKRTPPEEVAALVKSMGFADIADMCAAIGLPSHVALRWSRFGISAEMSLVLGFLAKQRQGLAKAATDFDSWNHVGLEDFMHDRGLI